MNRAILGMLYVKPWSKERTTESNYQKEVEISPHNNII